MQKYSLAKKHPVDVLKDLKASFTTLPVVTRDCVKAINTLMYNMQHQEFAPEILREVVFQILRSQADKDHYLKRCIYAVLIEISRRSSDGILSITSLIKDIDDSGSKEYSRDAALRALYSNLPSSMYYDFEKYIKSAIHAKRDTAVVVAQQFLCQNSSNATLDYISDRSLANNVSDYHRAYFLRMQVNRYSGLMEIRRVAKEDPERLSGFLYVATDPMIMLEASKALLKLPPEIAAPHIDKAIHALSSLLRRDVGSVFAGMNAISRMSSQFPDRVARINPLIEELVHSPMESISMLAILTLLKTGTSETVRKLASKLEPYMRRMTSTYKTMAIDTIEQLALQEHRKMADSGSSAIEEYISFLRKALIDKGSLKFKLFILRKFERLLSDDISRASILKFLSGYLEDPEYYQLSMSILGLIGQFLDSPKELPHVYNRLILNNLHVRKCAMQALFDLSRRGVIEECEEALATFRDEDTSTHCDLLLESLQMPCAVGPFEMSELGSYRSDVLEYLDEEAAVEEEGDLIKECRALILSPEGADVELKLEKKIFKDKVAFKFFFENKVERVRLDGGQLALLRVSEKMPEESEKIIIKLEYEDFVDGKATKEIELQCEENDLFNGLFEYTISMEEDSNETDKDSFSLEPFGITVFDFMRPSIVQRLPPHQRAIELALDCKQTQIASYIADTVNLHFTSEGSSMVFSGAYKSVPVVIKISTQNVGVVVVSLDIFCEDISIAERACEVFE